VRQTIDYLAVYFGQRIETELHLPISVAHNEIHQNAAAMLGCRIAAAIKDAMSQYREYSTRRVQVQHGRSTYVRNPALQAVRYTTSLSLIYQYTLKYDDDNNYYNISNGKFRVELTAG